MWEILAAGESQKLNKKSLGPCTVVRELGDTYSYLMKKE